MTGIANSVSRILELYSHFSLSSVTSYLFATIYSPFKPYKPNIHYPLTHQPLTHHSSLPTRPDLLYTIYRFKCRIRRVYHVLLSLYICLDIFYDHLMKQSSTKAFPKGLIPSPFARQVKIFTHWMSGCGHLSVCVGKYKDN